MKVGVILVGALFAIAASGCSPDGSAPTSTRYATPTPEFSVSLLQQIATEVPGFAGMADDPTRNTLQVRMTHDVTDMNALQSAIVARFPELGRRRIEIIDWAERLGHVTEWQGRISGIDGVVMIGLSPSGEYIDVGVLSEDARTAAYREISLMGIPLEAVRIEVTGPVVLSGASG